MERRAGEAARHCEVAKPPSSDAAEKSSSPAMKKSLLRPAGRPERPPAEQQQPGPKVTE